jgi:hypothetical protein
MSDLFIVTVVNESEMDDETFYKHYLLRHDDMVRPFSYPCGATEVTRAFHNHEHRVNPGDFDHEHEEV